MISRDESKRMTAERTIIIDGAYGTGFFDMGLGGVPSEVLNLEHPDKVEALHRSYLKAGCGLLLTNTFGGNRFKLEENSLESGIRETHAAEKFGAMPGSRDVEFLAAETLLSIERAKGIARGVFTP
jgi:methionine synthase I (cobalamin-dependent)